MKSDRGHGVALAHLVPTPFQTSGVGAIIIVAPHLGLLLGLGRLLVPASLPYQARPGSPPGPHGRPLPRITANGTANSAEGGGAAALDGGRVGSTPVCPLVH
jgi:hypothetical protein